MDIFVDHTPTTAPESARGMVSAAEAQFGFVPSPVARMSTSPATLEGFLKLNAIFQKSSLDELSREVLILSVATRNECHYCVAMHSTMLTRSGAPAALVEALRDSKPLADERLEAVRLFTHSVMDNAGAVPPEQMQTFFDAGFTPENALDVVLGIATYTVTTFANRMTNAPLDEPFKQWKWTSTDLRTS